MPENAPPAPTAAQGPWRSKRRVLLLVLATMIVMSVGGIVFRVVHPTEEDRIVRDLPRYPGARGADFPATEPDVWARYGAGFSDAIVLSYVLPNGTSRDAVLRYYGTHMPRSFSRDGATCWARGDSRVLLVPQAGASPTLDVAVATGDAACPAG